MAQIASYLLEKSCEHPQRRSASAVMSSTVTFFQPLDRQPQRGREFQRLGGPASFLRSRPAAPTERTTTDREARLHLLAC